VKRKTLYSTQLGWAKSGHDKICVTIAIGRYEKSTSRSGGAVDTPLQAHHTHSCGRRMESCCICLVGLAWGV